MKNKPIGNKKLVDGYPVDFTKKEALDILNKAKWRIIGQREEFFGVSEYLEEVEVFYKNTWWELARTDLKDDICTGECTRRRDKKNPVGRFINACRYGARLYKHKDKRRTFAVIDSFSDG